MIPLAELRTRMFGFVVIVFPVSVLMIAEPMLLRDCCLTRTVAFSN